MKNSYCEYATNTNRLNLILISVAVDLTLHKFQMSMIHASKIRTLIYVNFLYIKVPTAFRG